MKTRGIPQHPAETDGFAARLREVVDAYGAASTLAKAIRRSEGAVRKWLRAESSPNVSDLRAICEATGTNVEWLVMGRGEPRTAYGVREPRAFYGAADPLPPIDYELMDEVVKVIDAQSQAAGRELLPPKRSSVLTTVYNMSRATRSVDPETVARILALAS